MSEPVRVAVFASGGGTNLQSLLDHFNGGRSPAARVELVIASRAGAGALARAEAADVPAVILSAREHSPERLADLMLRSLDERRIGLVVLAGYLQLVPTAVVERYRGRMLNIHPALLPAFGGKGMYGLRVHRAVLDAGALVTGATVHLVDERYDEGAILAQWPVPVLADDTPEKLAARVLRVEHVLLPAVVEGLAAGRAAGVLDDAAAFELAGGAAPDPISVRNLIRAAAPVSPPSD